MDLYGFIRDIACCKGSFVSLTGGGGKTTLMVMLAEHLRSCGMKVLMTTTTKIMSPKVHDYRCDRVFPDDSVLDFHPDGPCSVLYAIEDTQTNKWRSPSLDVLERLRSRYDVVINEADGSRRLPLKVHTDRDPVVPGFSTFTISIMGLWALGHRTTEVAFGEDRDVLVDHDYLVWYANAKQGLLKGSTPGSRMVLFNGSEDCVDLDQVRDIGLPEDVIAVAASEKEGIVHERLQ